MGPARGNADNIGQSGDLNRLVLILKGSVPELAKVVLSPGPDSTVLLERDAEKIPRGQFLNPGQIQNWQCDHGILVGSVSDLSVFIVAPGPDRAVLFQGNGVVKARGHANVRGGGKGLYPAGHKSLLFRDHRLVGIERQILQLQLFDLDVVVSLRVLSYVRGRYQIYSLSFVYGMGEVLEHQVLT